MRRLGVVVAICFAFVVSGCVDLHPAALAQELQIPVYTLEPIPSTKQTWQTWKAIGSGTGYWTVDGVTVKGRSVAGDSILVSPGIYSDFLFSAVVSTTNREASLFFRIQDAANCYEAVFLPDGIAWRNGVGGLWFYRRVGYTGQLLGYYYSPGWPRLGEKAHIQVLALVDRIVILMNGKKVFDVRDSAYASGRVGLRIYGDTTYPCDSWFELISIYDFASK